MNRLGMITLQAITLFTISVPMDTVARVQFGKGLKAGFVISSFRHVSPPRLDINFEPKLGFSGGGFLTYNICEWVAIQPEVLFTMKGAKRSYLPALDDFPQIQRGERAHSLNYLEFFVLAKFFIPIQGTLKPNLLIGPSLSTNLSGRIETEYPSGINEEYVPTERGNDVGLVFGAGIDLDHGPGTFMIDTRYNWGLITVSGYDFIDRLDVAGHVLERKNTVISFMVGYAF